MKKNTRQNKEKNYVESCLLNFAILSGPLNKKNCRTTQSLTDSLSYDEMNELKMYSKYVFVSEQLQKKNNTSDI